MIVSKNPVNPDNPTIGNESETHEDDNVTEEIDFDDIKDEDESEIKHEESSDGVDYIKKYKSNQRHLDTIVKYLIIIGIIIRILFFLMPKFKRRVVDTPIHQTSMKSFLKDTFTLLNEPLKNKNEIMEQYNQIVEFLRDNSTRESIIDEINRTNLVERSKKVILELSEYCENNNNQLIIFIMISALTELRKYNYPVTADKTYLFRLIDRCMEASTLMSTLFNFINTFADKNELYNGFFKDLSKHYADFKQRPYMLSPVEFIYNLVHFRKLNESDYQHVCNFLSESDLQNMQKFEIYSFCHIFNRLSCSDRDAILNSNECQKNNF
ncbi:hypothetical protein TVAG_035890 [Trichomonas vaginalis G3]|uniref:Uncharacterized protein n=1 Tax=Trichomonas vaginalis (strain ATCC PRA-98 / G3) TaxID=412133 RepID=A2DAR2_TRIV3|nr:hypothetical protein TVAGG3_0812330 [Trichomonas vaginalis G3]EAY22565.1 hypothetical protein TVAG_035890 [Trichomonas vaginalis G3]KAI5497297.1 hypothetical protein TVAGG3_0812330 [Trichomonas vaginalis G3]|eukprot:XP_001583551.1 hypothetical protein [Trichomonas vaginalis G3]